MSIWKKFLRAIGLGGNTRTSEEKPTPAPIEAKEPEIEVQLPKEESNTNTQVLDTVNDGSGVKPDWSFIADNCYLDEGVREKAISVGVKITSGMARYKIVEQATGVPWYCIGLIHLREASLRWNACLHNGEDLSDVNKYGTKLVPKGLGKGKNWTWEEAAIDAIRHDGLDKVMNWSIAKVLEMNEKFNGLGYRKQIGDSGEVEYSPYVTAGTNWSDETGKYIADGKYSKTAKEGQLGVLAVLIGMGLVVERKPSNPIQLPQGDMFWYAIAKTQLGVTEIAGSKHNQRIVEYHSFTTLKATDDETPWCSSFVSWCLEHAEIKSTKNAWARSYLEWGKKIEKPVEGCVVIFSRGSSSGHVAFYVGETLTTVKCLGGNQGNTVCIDEYPKWRVLGYRLPK